MKPVIFLSFLFSLAALASRQEIYCHDLVEGDDLGGKFETTVTINSALPLIEETLVVTLGSTPPTTHQTSYLGPDSVCGVPLNYAKECDVKESLGDLGYQWSFHCDGKVTFAEVYCDENCMQGKGGVTFRCEGPQVDPAFSGGGLVFSGCKGK